MKTKTRSVMVRAKEKVVKKIQKPTSNKSLASLMSQFCQSAMLRKFSTRIETSQSWSRLSKNKIRSNQVRNVVVKSKSSLTTATKPHNE